VFHFLLVLPHLKLKFELCDAVLNCSESLCFFFNLVCEAVGTAATPGLLCQPRVIMKLIVEKQMDCRLAGETKVLGENLPQHHFCPSKKPTWPDLGRHSGKPATNRLSYGAAPNPRVNFVWELWHSLYTVLQGIFVCVNQVHGSVLNGSWCTACHEAHMDFANKLAAVRCLPWGVCKFCWWISMPDNFQNEVVTIHRSQGLKMLSPLHVDIFHN
jgi:hypothetical protein